jgi:GNAT superfamily N-acetyltransferase
MKLRLIEHEVLDDTGGITTFMDVDGITLCRIYWYDDRDSLYMDSLDVSEAHRGKGIGTYLQEYREDRARQMGYDKTMLWVKKGTWMVDWYTRRGYVFHDEYLEEDAIWMLKKLGKG